MAVWAGVEVDAVNVFHLLSDEGAIETDWKLPVGGYVPTEPVRRAMPLATVVVDDCAIFVSSANVSVQVPGSIGVQVLIVFCACRSMLNVADFV